MSIIRPSRVAGPDPAGALFKRAAIAPRRVLKSRARCRDAAHLEAIRQCPCLACGRDPAGIAAHVRLPLYDKDKPITGTGLKPDDRWSLPLCAPCHIDQHAIGERTFWEGFAVAPLTFAERLYRLSDNIEAMRAVCWGALAGRE